MENEGKTRNGDTLDVPGWGSEGVVLDDRPGPDRGLGCMGWEEEEEKREKDRRQCDVM